ncbi:MAG: hypothetical protein FJ087_22985 [Deltaproteobacteria bacterium]|nr:hypothetical protein [Deltaproteobacteria bacterium]
MVRVIGAGLSALALAAAQQPTPDALAMRWGVENTHAYRDTMRAEDEHLRVKSASPKKYRTFAFAADDPEVTEPYQTCLQAHQRSWVAYQKAQKPSRVPGPPPGSEAARARFRATFATESPTCMAVFKQLAPTLFFDFTRVGTFVLERLEVKTLAFVPYTGGGLTTKESWNDLTLPHTPGWKPYPAEPALSFTGNGRLRLRLWSDNADAGAGWATAMGEFLIDITFVFSAAGQEVRVSTGPFKIDV